MYDETGSVKSSRYMHRERSTAALGLVNPVLLLVSVSASLSKDEAMNGICDEDRDGRDAIRESLMGGVVDPGRLDENWLMSCTKTSSEFGQFPPLRFVSDTALSLESSAGK